MAHESRFIGLKEANAALRQLPDFAKPKAQGVMDVSAFLVFQGAEARVKRRTGFLASQLDWASRPQSVSAVVGVNDGHGLHADERPAFYWKFLEYGTVKMAAQPFMRPAAEAVEADHESRLVRALSEAADQVERAASGGGTGLL